MAIKRTMADNWSPSPFRSVLFRAFQLSSIHTALINPLS